MAGDTVITFIGNTTADPEGHFFPSGAFVANFTVANTPRTFDKNTGEWKDGDATFLRCNAWGQRGEHVVDSISRGDRVIVQGRLKQRSFTDKEGEKRTVFELDIDAIGPELSYATAEITKAPKKTKRTQPAKVDEAPPATEPPAEFDDPWGTAPEPQLAGAGSGGSGFDF
ncbi:single-stranded DNA-binding protein [Saccharothrix sp. AJ9571]|nr:single-stranded DNA-binding protein [Saccharothrix sp. AJ9571]